MSERTEEGRKPDLLRLYRNIGGGDMRAQATFVAGLFGIAA